MLKKLTSSEKTAVLAAGILLVLFLTVSVLAAVLFGMLNSREKKYSDYKSDAEIELSELEKQQNAAKKEASELKNKLEIAEKSKDGLEDAIASLEAEMKALQDGFSNKDELYGSLNKQLDELKTLLDGKNTEIEALKKSIAELEKSHTVDLADQYKLITELEKLLSEGAPMKKLADGYTYPKISLYYADLSGKYTYSWKGDTVYNSSSCVMTPFAYTVFNAASEEKADYDKELERLMAQNVPQDKLPVFKPEYDFVKVFTYGEEHYNAGSGVIKNDEFGVQYSYLELMNLMLRYSDSIAFEELKAEYGTAMLKSLSKSLDTSAMRNNINTATATDLGKVMKRVYDFIESDAEYAGAMKEAMLSSAHSEMISYGVSPKKAAHQYGWGENAYHDMAIVYDVHPYVLVIMTDMDEGSDEINKYIQKVSAKINELHEAFYG